MKYVFSNSNLYGGLYFFTLFVFACYEFYCLPDQLLALQELYSVLQISWLTYHGNLTPSIEQSPPWEADSRSAY